MELSNLLKNRLTPIIGLIILATMLYVVGISIERAKEANKVPATQQESEPETENHSEASEPAGANDAETNTQHEETANETLLGINLEAPEIVAGIVLGWLALIATLLIFKQRALFFGHPCWGYCNDL